MTENNGGRHAFLDGEDPLSSDLAAQVVRQLPLRPCPVENAAAMVRRRPPFCSWGPRELASRARLLRSRLQQLSWEASADPFSLWIAEFGVE